MAISIDETKRRLLIERRWSVNESITTQSIVTIKTLLTRIKTMDKAVFCTFCGWEGNTKDCINVCNDADTGICPMCHCDTLCDVIDDELDEDD